MAHKEEVKTELLYLQYDQRYEHEKLYILNYDSDVMPRSNAINKPYPVSIRPAHDSNTLSTSGFTKVKLRSSLTREEFEQRDKVKDTFYPEVKTMLRDMYPQAAKVEILEHLIRKRHHEFPIATGKPYQDLLPTTLAHIDFSPNSAARTSRAAFKYTAEKYPHLLCVNVWKSLQGAGNDWPLALCDRRTVDYNLDVVVQDSVWENRFSENMRLYYSARHEWHYYKDLKEDEVVIFQQMDSKTANGAGVPHSGFHNPDASEDAAPRVSLELRAYIYFE